MKKNILFLVIDSVTNDVAFNKSNSKDIMPFLYELRKKSISGDKMFSEAPYTEAALMSLLGSVDTMDNGGYLERMKHISNVLEDFQKKGYTTFFPNYYPSIYPSYMVKGYDYRLYIDCFDINQFWSYRLEYYSVLYNQNELTLKELNMLCEMLEDNFLAWIDYLKKLKNRDVETKMLNDCIDLSDIDSDIKLVEKEFQLFKTDPLIYLKKILIKRKDHELFKIKTYMMTDKIRNDNIRNNIINENKKTFDRIAKLVFKNNLLNNHFPYSKAIRSIFKGDFRTVKGLLAGYKNSIFDKDLYERIAPHFDTFKNQRSFYTVSLELMDWISKHKNEKWISYVHIDDAHYEEQFFTYDTTDMSIVKNDFKRINNYLDKIPKKYRGNIAYDLSLNYCDNIIKNIYNFLNSKNLLKDTYIVITADHGFSYYFSPIREKYVISNYKENYNVPFIIYGSDIKPRMINGYCQTKDIPTTLLSLANIKPQKQYKGVDLLTSEGKEYALLEYMGGGCPDILRRPVVLGVRTDNYAVMTKIFINNSFDNVIIEEVYDLKKDPHENHNLACKKNIRLKICRELEILKSRYDEIIKQYK